MAKTTEELEKELNKALISHRDAISKLREDLKISNATISALVDTLNESEQFKSKLNEAIFIRKRNAEKEIEDAQRFAAIKAQGKYNGQ